MTDEDWTFGGTWPYEPHWFDTSEGRMHYIDEGPREGRPVVCVHGNPTWGYLYRNFVPPLVEAGYRVVVPDHLGFGRSDKPSDAKAYGIPLHSRRLVALLESLGLEDATVVVQDWGGVIGLSWPARRPEKVRSLFIMNTLAHRPEPDASMPGILRFIRAPIIGEVLVKGLHAFVRALLLRSIRPERRDEQTRAAYLAPHPTYGSRTGILAFPRQIPSSPRGPVADFFDEVHRGLAAFKDRPVAFAWAKKDPAFTPRDYERSWAPDFPDAPVLWLEEAGHFLQEDAPDLIVPRLLELLAR
jgi:haloalkane dehalogenase